jgi:hypothetical protein
MTARPTSKAVGLRHGFRSGLEDKVGAELSRGGAPFTYEEDVIHYVVPPRTAKYTPDFLLLDNGIVVETKGRFVTADRQKHLLLKEQHPAIDIRFVFSNPRTRISKGSKTTYEKWCVTHGFKYAAKTIPAAWLTEARVQARFDALKAASVQPLKNKELQEWFHAAFAAAFS